MVATLEMLITLGGVVLVGYTLYHTKRMADAANTTIAVTREMGRAQTRAYLAIKGAYLRQGTWKDTIYIELANIGETPVRWLETEGNVQVLSDAKITADKVTVDPIGSTKNRWAVDPGAKGKNFICDTDCGNVKLKEHVRAAMNTTSLVFQGTVRWETMFNEIFESTFFFWAVPHSPIIKPKGGVKAQRLALPSAVETIAYRLVQPAPNEAKP